MAYLRVSTDHQHLGPEAQRAQINAWAARAGVVVVAWHHDQGISGATPLDGRPGLQMALEDLRAHGAGVLVVAKRDRLARDVIVAATVEQAARRAGASVIAADGAGNGDGPAEEMLRHIMDAVAAWERKTIAGRVKAALAVKAARGERTGNVPRGLRVGDDGRRLEEDPDERAVIERARSLRASGMSFRRIVVQLEEEGARARTGAPLKLSAVHSMCSAPTPAVVQRAA